MAKKPDIRTTQAFIDEFWESKILPPLTEFVAIPALSPNFDAEWSEHGHLHEAARLMKNWVDAQNLGTTAEIIELPGHSPLLFVDVAATGEHTKCCLLYGHLDKQPPMTEAWSEGLGPWKPVFRQGKYGKQLFGRGAADDGYALFASVACIKALREQGVPHPRCILMIESSEESGSKHLMPYVDHLAPRIGSLDLIICLDSGAGNYDQFWLTTSLRGLASQILDVQILKNGVHSGLASGIVPSTFRIARQLLSRLEDQDTGNIVLPDLHVEVPQSRLEQAKLAADVLGPLIYNEFPFVAGAQPATSDLAQLILNRTWSPAMEVIGADGFPSLATAGNVLRPVSSFKISMRLPPTLPGKVASDAIKRALEQDPPYNAHIQVRDSAAASGWNAPELSSNLAQALDVAARGFFDGKPPVFLGEGGSIPFMGMLGAKFPQAQFIVTGVLGPNSNAHGPDECLEVEFAKKCTATVAHILAEL